MKIITTISRILVGGLFIFSGFIKANDPLGFGYKLEEYFEVFGMPSLIPSAVYLSIFICIFEIVIGFMLLLGSKMKFTLWMLGLMIVFFTFLTFYSAYFNKVTDCGCFGDFILLTPWQSFTKDIILLFLIAIIVLGRNNIYPLLTSMPEKVAVGIFTLISTIFPFYTWSHLPIFDFRPYKVGTNILEAMKVPPGGEGKFETTLFYKNLQTGEVKGFKSTEKYPWDDTLHWKADRDPETRTLVEPKLAPIHDFSLTNIEGSEYTEDILTAPGPKFFLVCRDLSETKRKVFGQVNDFADLCRKDSVMFIGLTSSSKNDIEALQKETGSKFEFYFSDGTQLKTMIRSNPGLILLDGAVVKAMWPASGLPAYNDIKEKYFKNKKSR